MPQNPESNFPGELEVLSQIINRGLLLLDGNAELEFANALACDLLGCSNEADLKQRWAAMRPLLGLETPPLKSLSFKVDVPMKSARRCLRVEIRERGEKFGNGYLLLLKDRQKMDGLETNLLLASQMHTQIYLQGGVAHDLRAPLNAMHITLELLGETLAGSFSYPDKSSQQRCVAVLKEELARLNQKLQSVFTANTSLNPARQKFGLRALLEEITQLLQTSARRYRLDLQCRLPEREIELSGQREWFKQALLNVAINSMQAMPNGGILEIDIQLENPVVSIIIKDQGPSLSAAQSQEIYAVSFAAAGNPTRAGLHVARMLVELHDGDFQLAASADKGNCFTLILPLAQDSAVGGNVSARRNVLAAEKIR